MNRAARRVVLGLLFSVFLLGSILTVRAPSFNQQALAAGALRGSEKGGTGNHELLFKVINSTLLVVALAVLLRKPLAEFFAQRSASIRRNLEEGRKALEASEAQLRAVEGKLGRLEQDIAALKSSATQEMQAERERLRQATAEEVEKILASGRAQFETASRTAKLELKTYAAQQAIDLAEEMIRKRVDEATRRGLFRQFLAGLS